MIKKNLTYILPVIALSLIVFTNSMFKADSTKTDSVKVADTFSFKNTIDRATTNDFLAKSRKNSLRLSKQYQKRLLKSNLTEKLLAVADNQQIEEPLEKRDPSKKLAATSKDETDKKKKDEEKSKKDAEAKNASKKGEDLEPYKTAEDSDQESLPKRSESRNNDTEVSSISFSSFVPKNTVRSDELNPDDDYEENDVASNTDIVTNPSTPTVESFDVFSISYFYNLLTNAQLQEFEQAFKTVLKDESNSKNINNAYTAALNFLFTKDGEEFVTYDNFIRTQFLRHSVAVNLSSVFTDSTMSTEKIEYTAGLLNELVLSWDINKGDSSLFSEVYQLAVLNAIHSDIANNEALLTLQNSIATTSFYISNPGVEVSAN